MNSGTRLTLVKPGAAASASPPAPVVAQQDVDAVGVTKVVAAGLFGAAMAYAVLRYVVLGTVAATDTPLFVANKAVSFAGVALLAGALALTPLMAVMPRLAKWAGLRKTFGVAGFGFSAVHVVMTMAMLGPVYYGKLYAAAGAGGAMRLTIQGQLAVLAGIASLAALILPAITSFGGIKAGMKPEAWRSMQKFAVVALVTAGLHLVALGYKTWISTSAWPGGLPPITLISIAVVVGALVVRQLFRPRA